jgi:asparagine synthase (glutamine-hydrolysing)
MIAALERRGPDGGGVQQLGAATLGHRRLAILDLSDAGHQPMLTSDRMVGVVFNGAIYNYLELRTELAARGYSFRSHTDTEVLLYGYREWGFDGLVARLAGMFAIALWDDARRTAYLVRDRLGVKPLVYVATPEAIGFASTPRALRAGGLVEEIDEAAVAEFLEFGFITDGRVIYRGAVKVPAATIVEWRDGRLSSREYWVPPSPDADPALSFEEAVSTTERLLLRAVERRLHADVPVGALLSGGIDSTLVCWAIKQLGADVTAYTIGVPGDPTDESTDAIRIARMLGIRHRTIDLSAAASPSVEELVSAYAEPFACGSALGMLKVSEAVAPSAKVLLTGDGGDDVFLGYPRHRHLWAAQRLARRAPTALATSWNALRGIIPRPHGPIRRAANFTDYVAGGLGAFVQVHDGLPYYHERNLLGDRLRDAQVVQRSIPRSPGSARRVLTDYLEYDRRTQFVAEYMTKVDGATMHHGIEARSPFLDQELWAFASALPYSLRLNRGELKAVLREITRRRVGAETAAGRKRGFSVPVQQWLAGRWRPQIEAVLSDSLLARRGWINGPAVIREMRKLPGSSTAPDQLWYLFVLESWMRSETDTSNLTAPGLRDVVVDSAAL